MRHADIGFILELGNQNIYFGDEYGSSAKPYLKKLGFLHTSVDINGQDGAEKMDLSKRISYNDILFDIVTDFGTSEHVKDYYNCWYNKHNWCKLNGIIISENPKTGNWPGHGFHYLTELFYQKLAYMVGYEILEIGEHAAMSNTTDGWNIYCVLKKRDKDFIPRKLFEKLDFRNE